MWLGWIYYANTLKRLIDYLPDLLPTFGTIRCLTPYFSPHQIYGTPMPEVKVELETDLTDLHELSLVWNVAKHAKVFRLKISLGTMIGLTFCVPSRDWPNMYNSGNRRCLISNRGPHNTFWELPMMKFSASQKQNGWLGSPWFLQTLLLPWKHPRLCIKHYPHRFEGCRPFSLTASD